MQNSHKYVSNTYETEGVPRISAVNQTSDIKRLEKQQQKLLTMVQLLMTNVNGQNKTESSSNVSKSKPKTKKAWVPKPE